MSTFEEKLRQFMAQNIDPVDAYALGQYGEDAKEYLRRRGLKKPTPGYSFDTSTAVGSSVEQWLAGEFARRLEAMSASDEDAAPEPVPTDITPSVESAMASIRAEAAARGGHR